MLYRYSKALAVCFVCALTLCASITKSHADDPVNLKRVYKTGESDKYQTTITIDAKDPNSGNMLKVVISASTTDETKEIKFDGSVLLSMKIDSASFSINGMSQPVPINGASFLTTLDKDGKVVKQELGEGPAAQLGQLLTLTRLSLMPDRPLKPGEEFKFETENKAKVAVTLVGKEPKNDEVAVETLKVKTTIDSPATAPQSLQKVKVDATSLLEPGTGKVLRTVGSLDGPLGQLPPGAKVTFKVLRLKDSAK